MTTTMMALIDNEQIDKALLIIAQVGEEIIAINMPSY